MGIHTTRYQLGDTKTFTHETYGEVVMQIVAFDADDKADGSGKAAISWVSRDIITKQKMNSTATNEGGWADTELRTWLQSEFYDKLPANVKAVIVEVNKTYYDYTDKTTETCADKVWIPSVGEIFGNSYDTYGCEKFGADYTGFFNNESSRVKNYSGSACPWWLRSAYISAGNSFRNVGYYGTCHPSGGAAYQSGIVLGFCTDASDIVPAPIDPTSLLMGYRVGQMIRGCGNSRRRMYEIYPNLPFEPCGLRHNCLLIN